MNPRTLAATLCALLLWLGATAQTRVACIGNSITYGFLVENREANAYPAQLQRMLGDGYSVVNFGHSGSTLLNRGHNPYMALPEFRDAMRFRPDIAVIHLGINDTDPRDWPEHGDAFAGDYMALIDSLRAANPDVRIIVANLTPLSATHFRFRSGTRLWRLKIRRQIADIARAAGVELIDFDTTFRDRQNLLVDGIHPNAAGATLMAEAVRNAITGVYGGLRLPDVWQSGMVVQRRRPLPIAGQSDAGRDITLTLDGVTYRTRSDNTGQWQVLTAPLATGGPYTLTVSDGAATLTLTDILAGEVWLASGQSNMEFPLSASRGGAEAASSAADTLLRFYDMRPIARTDNVEWTPETVAAVDSLRYFLPTRWEEAAPGNAAKLSAIAYYFARELRRAMPDVPIGIVSNAVGGSTTESWIDVNTLEDRMPEDLVNWQTNDYIQKWAQGRAIRNSGKGHRHPYEPSYLFSSAIRPAGALPLAGVIWYQGESNAHNTDIHEQLFPMLVDSWRRHFRSPQLPFIFAQLSSIDRPSWPAFRDSQRRLAERVPATAMIVTSDHGDSLDVHPTDKLPVGRRFARQALRRVYGIDSIVPQGPTLLSATAAPDGSVTLAFEWADGMKTSDGAAPSTFEIAETEGIYFPAEARIDGNKITVKNMEMKKPRFVRYAWQPFTRANVVNGEGLPLSTFKTAVDGSFEPEEGLEYGVSAPFAGRFADRLIVAGGCNFPTADPFAPGATKKFYRGIYAADAADVRWQRIGSLPEPTAYGVAVQVSPDEILLAGGQTPDGSTDKVRALRPDGSLTELPKLPATVDNAAGACIGRRVYIAGGNVGGVPSRRLFVLDLDRPADGWKELKKMPGNPRVQPVMAAATDATGRTCLYLWGGFAGRHDGNEPTLELGGLTYNPTANRWSEIEGPTGSDGEPTALGGGCAATLADGTIAAAGGVNKEVFLQALINQAPDYLEHPVAWYRLNPDVFVFDPVSSRWRVACTDAEAARAGAVMIAGTADDIFISGGELKPRIRSAATIHINGL